MEFKFNSHKLELLYTEQKGARDYGDAVVNAFFKVMAIIASAKDEQDIRAFRSLHYEKLKGDRSHQHSLRLNKQWRLIFEIRKEHGKHILVIEIEDYH
jgi:proteic killer suppression protein